MALEDKEIPIPQLITLPGPSENHAEISGVESEINTGVFEVTEFSCARLLNALKNLKSGPNTDETRKRKLGEVFVQLANPSYAAIAFDEDVLVEFPDLQKQLAQKIIEDVNGSNYTNFYDFCMALRATVDQEEVHTMLLDSFVEQNIPELFEKSLQDLVDHMGLALALKTTKLIKAKSEEL